MLAVLWLGVLKHCGCSCGCGWGWGWTFGGAFLVDFADHHSSPLLHVLCFANGAMWAPWAFFYHLLRHYHGMGDCSNFGFFSLMVGAGVGTGVGGIGLSFLVSNRFSEADPALDQRVPCITGTLGISSRGGRLSSRLSYRGGRLFRVLGIFWLWGWCLVG